MYLLVEAPPERRLLVLFPSISSPVRRRGSAGSADRAGAESAKGDPVRPHSTVIEGDLWEFVVKKSTEWWVSFAVLLVLGLASAEQQIVSYTPEQYQCGTYPNGQPKYCTQEIPQYTNEPGIGVVFLIAASYVGYRALQDGKKEKATELQLTSPGATMFSMPSSPLSGWVPPPTPPPSPVGRHRGSPGSCFALLSDLQEGDARGVHLLPVVRCASPTVGST